MTSQTDIVKMELPRGVGKYCAAKEMLTSEKKENVNEKSRSQINPLWVQQRAAKEIPIGKEKRKCSK